jgi:hypothetical protein
MPDVTINDALLPLRTLLLFFSQFWQGHAENTENCQTKSKVQMILLPLKLKRLSSNTIAE